MARVWMDGKVISLREALFFPVLFLLHPLFNIHHFLSTIQEYGM